MNLDEYYDYLVDYEIVTRLGLDLIVGINGYNTTTLDDVLYYYTGYRSIEQYLEYEDPEMYIEYYSEDEE